MTRRGFLGLCAGALYALALGRADGGTEKKSVLLIGDSLAVGISTHFKKLVKQHGMAAHSFAIGGTNTLQWAVREWLPYSLKQWKPDYVFVILGTNDYGTKHSRDKFKERAARVVEKITNSGAECIWLTPPKNRINNDFIYEGAVESGAEVFDFRDLVVKLQKDRIHLTYKGNIVWSKVILEKFINLIK